MFFRTIAVCCYQLMQQPDGGTEENREMLLEGKNAVIYEAGGAIGGAVVD